MIELVVELLLELFGELLFNALIDATSRGVSVIWSSRATRWLFGALLSSAAGYGGGYWWGRQLSDVRATPPKLLYVSALLACAFTLAAIVRARNASAEAAPVAVYAARRSSWANTYWSSARLANFAVVNIAVAIGVATGFHPHVPG